MPNAQRVAIRIAATGRGVYQDVILPEGNTTVGGALQELASRGVDYNGQEVTMLLNGRPVDVDAAVEHLDSLVIVPEKPTGN